MKLWADLYDYYLAEIPGCSLHMAANQLRMSAQEFCERTKAWRVTLAPVSTIADTSAYDFVITAEHEVFMLESAKLDGQNLDILLNEHIGGCWRGISLVNQREYWLQPAPAAGQVLELKVVLKPSNESTGIEDFLYAAHAETIALGAKARLLALSNQPFTSPEAAMMERAKFEERMGRAKIRIAKGNSSAPLRVRPSFM